MQVLPAPIIHVINIQDGYTPLMMQQQTAEERLGTPAVKPPTYDRGRRWNISCNIHSYSLIMHKANQENLHLWAKNYTKGDGCIQMRRYRQKWELDRYKTSMWGRSIGRQFWIAALLLCCKISSLTFVIPFLAAHSHLQNCTLLTAPSPYADHFSPAKGDLLLSKFLPNELCSNDVLKGEIHILIHEID